METQINDVNDDCLLEILRLLRLSDLLSIGTMNMRFSRLVIENYAQSISHAAFNMDFDQRGTPHIIQLFGQFIRALELHFIDTIVPSTLFANEDECFINNMQQMRLCVCVYDEVDASLHYGQHAEHQLFNIDQIGRWVRMYERSIFNILDLVNHNDHHLGVIRFKFQIHFGDLNSYNHFSRYSNDFLRIIERKSFDAFRHLRRCSQFFDYAAITAFNQFKFNLNFLPGNVV